MAKTTRKESRPRRSAKSVKGRSANGRPTGKRPALATRAVANPFDPALGRLWAPWRLEYIRNNKADDACPFCELPRLEPSDETLVLYRDEELFVILNKFPYNPAHLLVVPRAHRGRPEEIDPRAWMRLSLALRLTLETLEKAGGAPAFNVGLNLGSVAGGGIPGHLHWHIVPRWPGDSNFMPILAETKTLPTHNRQVWAELRPHFLDFGRKLAETYEKGDSRS